MSLADIRSFPNLFFAPGGSHVHESCLRGYQILEKVKELLEKQTPPAVILEIVADLQAAPNVDFRELNR